MGFRPGLDRTEIERLLEREIRAGAPISAAALRRVIADAIEANNRALWEDLLATLGRTGAASSSAAVEAGYGEDRTAP